MIEVHCGLDGQLKAEAGTSASELYHSCKAKFGTDGVLFVKGSRVEIQSSHQAVQEGAYDWRGERPYCLYSVVLSDIGSLFAASIHN